MLSEARREIRSKFEASRLETNPEVINQQLAEAQEAAVFIREFVVQGVLNEEGNFAVKLEEQHADKVMSQEEKAECSSSNVTVEKRDK